MNQQNLRNLSNGIILTALIVALAAFGNLPSDQNETNNGAKPQLQRTLPPTLTATTTLVTTSTPTSTSTQTSTSTRTNTLTNTPINTSSPTLSRTATIATATSSNTPITVLGTATNTPETPVSATNTPVTPFFVTAFGTPSLTPIPTGSLPQTGGETPLLSLMGLGLVVIIVTARVLRRSPT